MDSEVGEKCNCNIRARGQSSQCNDDGSKIDRGFVADVSLVVSRVHRSKVFDFTKVIFDEMAPSVFDAIMNDWLFPIRF